MHGSLIFSKKKLPCTEFWNAICTAVGFSLKKTAVHCILECYMPGILFFSENTAVYYSLECCMHGSSIQFVVFKPLSYYFYEKIEFNK